MTGVINHTNTTPIQYPCKNSNSPKISVFGMKIKIELVLILVWSSETIRILNRDQSWPIVETIKIFRFKSINPSSLYTKLDFHRFPFISQTYHTTVFHPKYGVNFRPRWNRGGKFSGRNNTLGEGQHRVNLVK